MRLELRPEYKQKFERLKGGIVMAEVMALNAEAQAAGLIARKIVRNGRFPMLRHGRFVLRGKWVINSIFPREGKKIGLIPLYKKDLKTAVARSGSFNPHLRDHNEGLNVRNPQVPTAYARTSGDYRRKIGKHATLPILRKKTKQIPKRMRGPGKRRYSKRDKMKHFLAMLKNERYKGIIRVEKKGQALPPGWYRAIPGRAKKPKMTLRMVRFSQQGTKKRPATKWYFRAATSRLFVTIAQRKFNSAAETILQRIK